MSKLLRLDVDGEGRKVLGEILVAMTGKGLGALRRKGEDTNMVVMKEVIENLIVSSA